MCFDQSGIARYYPSDRIKSEARIHNRSTRFYINHKQANDVKRFTTPQTGIVLIVARERCRIAPRTMIFTFAIEAC